MKNTPNFNSFLKNKLALIIYYITRPRMLKLKINNKILRVSNTAEVTHWDKLELGNNVFIWHFSILDSFNQIKIGNDCQIGTRVGIFTHSSHHSIRYYNKKYYDFYFDTHKGRVRGPVEIGACSFVGANVIIMPNTKIGKGCIVTAFSYVQGDFDDFSIIAGNPAKRIGDIRLVDERFFKKHPDLKEDYLKYFGISSFNLK